MKKFWALFGSVALGVATIAGCGSSETSSQATDTTQSTQEATQAGSTVAGEDTGSSEAASTQEATAVESKGTITVAASATPHAEILEQVKPILAAEGWDLEVTVFDDYVQPNLVVDSGDIDANYFQHIPYLENFNDTPTEI